MNTCNDHQPGMGHRRANAGRHGKTHGLYVSTIALILLTLVCIFVPEVTAAAERSIPRPLLKRARQLEQTKNYQGALDLYRQYLAQDPENDEVRASIAKLLSWQGQYDEAVALYREILTRHPHDSDNRIALARVLSWQKNFVAAQEQYTLVLRDKPHHVDAMSGLADVLLWSGRREQALSYYEQVLAATGDADLAAKIRALKADLVAANQPQPVPAPEPVQSVQLPDRTEMARLLEEGRYLTAARRYPEAVARYREALTKQPDNDDIRTTLAQILAWDGKHGESTALYREVLERHPQDQESRIALARVLSWQKQFDAAHALYEEVLQADPTNLDARRGLAEVAHWQGNRVDALARYQALADETHDPDIERQLQAVKSELLVSPRAIIGQGMAGLRLPYRDYAKLGYGHYSYTRNQPDERDLLFEVAKPLGDQTLVLRVEPLNRFGLHDTPVSTEFYSPLWQRAWGYVAAQGTVNPQFTTQGQAAISVGNWRMS